MSDASDASDAVSTPSTVFSRVAASAAWKRLNRLMPALACRNSRSPRFCCWDSWL